MSIIANKARRHLISLGKGLPFALCFIILISYVESILSVVFNKYRLVNNDIIQYKPISQIIGRYFEYDWMTIACLTVLCFAIETCHSNKLAVAYLALHLTFKQWAANYEFLPTHIIGLCIINICICALLCYKGMKRIC